MREDWNCCDPLIDFVFGFDEILDRFRKKDKK